MFTKISWGCPCIAVLGGGKMKTGPLPSLQGVWWQMWAWYKKNAILFLPRTRYVTFTWHMRETAFSYETHRQNLGLKTGEARGAIRQWVRSIWPLARRESRSGTRVLRMAPSGECGTRVRDFPSQKQTGAAMSPTDCSAPATQNKSSPFPDGDSQLLPEPYPGSHRA